MGEKLNVAKATKYLADHLEDKRKHFKTPTIRKAARDGELRAVLVAEYMYVIDSDDLLEWANNAAVHKMGRPPKNR
jgi:NDP-sugar pyrophosphorylase family protein